MPCTWYEHTILLREYVCMYVCMYVCVCVYIYIYIERERERERVCTFENRCRARGMNTRFCCEIFWGSWTVCRPGRNSKKSVLECVLYRTCSLYALAETFKSQYSVNLCVCVCVCVCVLYICIHIYICICMYVCMYTWSHSVLVLIFQ